MTETTAPDRKDATPMTETIARDLTADEMAARRARRAELDARPESRARIAADQAP